MSPEDLAQFDSLSVSPTAQQQQQHEQDVNQPTSTAAPANQYGSYLVGAPDTASAFASRNPQGPKNPYNPFLQPSETQTQQPQQQQQQPQSSTLSSLQEISAAPAVDHAPPAATSAPAAPAEPRAWATKDIIFQGHERKIIMQNENGPCSLLAIANILLLRGDVALSPPDRPLVNYDYLSSLIAEYLLTRPETGQGGLDKALALLPQTQHGLNLNPSFLSNDSFSDGEQLSLFHLLGIKLYHGFVPDQSSPVEYELARMAGSYDAAVDQVVRGEEVTTRFFQEALGEANVSAALKELRNRGGYPIVESSGWGTALQKRTIEQALSLSEFLESNSSQLTYPGLFALSALPQGTLAALFRFNHLSVLYRPAAEAQQADSASPPTLLTLVTDDAFLDDELAVWETLADVDGRDSGDIYDSKLRRRPARGRDDIAVADQMTPSGSAAEDADYALALQLHSEERERAERRRAAYQQQQQHQHQPPRQRHPYSNQGWTSEKPQSSTSEGKGFKGFMSSLGLGKKKAKKGEAQSASASQPAQGEGTAGGVSSSANV